MRELLDQLLTNKHVDYLFFEDEKQFIPQTKDFKFYSDECQNDISTFLKLNIYENMKSVGFMHEKDEWYDILEYNFQLLNKEDQRIFDKLLNFHITKRDNVLKQQKILK